MITQRLTVEDLPCGPEAENLLASEGTGFQSPDWEDSTCHGATKPVCHS